MIVAELQVSERTHHKILCCLNSRAEVCIWHLVLRKTTQINQDFQACRIFCFASRCTKEIFKMGWGRLIILGYDKISWHSVLIPPLNKFRQPSSAPCWKVVNSTKLIKMQVHVQNGCTSANTYKIFKGKSIYCTVQKYFTLKALTF